VPNESHQTPGKPPRAAGSGGDVGRTLKTVGYVTLAVVVTIFLLRNSQSVEVDFVFASLEVPLFLVLLAALILGAILALGVAGLRRRRRRKAIEKAPASKRPEETPAKEPPPGDTAP
jgi:uncharacterized integral membrane protein